MISYVMNRPCLFVTGWPGLQVLDMLTSSYEDDMNTDFKTDSFFVNLFIGLVAITIFLHDTNDLRDHCQE